MKTKKILKGTLIIIAVTLILLVLNIGESKAALQSNPNTQHKKQDIPEDWMKNFRQMEVAGGAMGLNETLNSDLTASSDSNNIDVHMMRATEYGAIAILSASGYGNPSNVNAITSTTGNNTGVILKTNDWEWTAGGTESIFSGTNSRYFDTYTSSNTSARAGDALGNDSTANQGCSGWHSAAYYNWTSSDKFFGRGSGGMFSFGGYSGNYKFYCRGVAVCGKRTLKFFYL